MSCESKEPRHQPGNKDEGIADAHLSNATLVENVPPRLESDTSFTNNLSVDYFECEIDDDFRILVQSFEDSTQQSLRFDHLRLESDVRGREE